MLDLFKKIYALAEDFHGDIILAVVLKFVDSILALVPLGGVLWFYQQFVNDTLPSNAPWIVFGILFGGVVVRTLVHYQIDKREYSTMYATFAKERIRVADHLKQINMGFFSDDTIGRVTTVMTNGISFIEEQSVQSIATSLTSCVSIVVIFFMLCGFHVGVALIYALTCVVVFGIFYAYGKKSRAFATAYNTATKDSAGAVIEYVKNISVIKAFGLTGKHGRSNEAFANQRKVDLQGEVINITHIIGALTVTALSGAGILLYVITTYVAGNLPLETMVLLAIFSLYVYHAIELLAMKLAMMDICADNLKSVEDLHKEAIMPTPKDLKPKGYDIEFKNVSFGYGADNVLNDMSFHLKESTMTALVGLSGSGKSTLVNLIPRFFDIEQGEILIGGVNIKDMSTETLYGCISMVFQNIYLFQDTIYNNIAFGNESASHEDVVEACKKAKCYDFIMALPDQFDTMVGEAGMSLSGGERQRISIARAILKDAPIILLDEATASVDPDNESEIQDAINALVEGKTILVIAHKLSCVKNAQSILVLKEGKLAEEGTHDALLTQGGLYADLWGKRLTSKSWKIANETPILS